MIRSACKSTRTAGAFTLFEALVALAVFSFAVLGFVGAFEAALDSAREVRREAFLRQVLEDRIAFLENAPLFDTDNSYPGPVPGMTIRETIFPEQLVDEEQNILAGFWKLTVSITWQRDGTEETLEASFLRYGT